MDLSSWYIKDDDAVVTIEEVTGVTANSTDFTWGNQQTSGFRIEKDVMRKNRFQHEVNDRFDQISLEIELEEGKTYRVWLPSDNTADAEDARMVDQVRVVRDRWNRFIHTVITL